MTGFEPAIRLLQSPVLPLHYTHEIAHLEQNVYLKTPHYSNTLDIMSCFTSFFE